MPREHRSAPRARASRGSSPARPRVLVLAESLPYPTLKGGDLRTWQNVNALASVADVGVFGLCSNDRRSDRRPDLDLLCWTTSTDAALTSPPPTGVRLPGRAWLLDPRGHPSDLYFSEDAARELAQLLASIRPDVVLLEGLWLQRYLGIVRAAGCRTILDCHNVEAALFRELAQAVDRHDLEGRIVRDVLPARTEAIERDAVHEVDQLWVCSADDEHRLRQLYDQPTPTFVIPNGIRLEDFEAPDAAWERPAGATPLTMLFHGIFAYRPNAIAAAFLLEEVLPRLVAACDTCRLVLVGPLPKPQMLAAAARDPRVIVTGAVADVRPHLADATVLAVPLFQGGGTHLKVLEAFAAGLPVVSTTKGAEGLGARDGTHLLVAETAAEFVEAALAVWRRPALGARLRAEARALVARRFSWQAVGAAVRPAIAALGA